MCAFLPFRVALLPKYFFCSGIEAAYSRGGKLQSIKEHEMSNEAVSSLHAEGLTICHIVCAKQQSHLLNKAHSSLDAS